jgi:DNA-binding NtrC family response regulator
VVAATHRALREEVRAGRFREDLMYRLRVVPVFLPPLRERPADVPLLLRAFLDEANARGPRRVTSIDPAATRALLAWPWPGNVRELQNVVTYAFAVGRAPVMGLDDLPPELRDPPEEAGALVTAPPAAAPPVRRRRGPDPAAVEAALRATGGDLREAAARLGVSRTTLWRWRTTPPPGDPR